jgi:hypothetical protein
VDLARVARYAAHAMATEESNWLEHLLIDLSTRFTGLPGELIDAETRIWGVASPPPAAMKAGYRAGAGRFPRCAQRSGYMS